MEEIMQPCEEDQQTMSLEQPETSSVMMAKPVKIEDDVECKSNPLCSTNGGSKSRQHLKEGEKEARKLRRILANRESARQTIRRRQAMFEALSRKAVDLALENDNLKKDKEVAVQEYESLKTTNDCLKAQVAEIMRAEAEIEKKSKLSNSEISTSVTSLPTTTPSCNLASVDPFRWPMPFQPQDASVDQCRMEGGTATPLVPMMQLWRPDSFLGQGSSVLIANPGTLLCVLPFPCFVPFHGLGSAGQPQSSELIANENETSTIHQCSGTAHSSEMLNRESSLPLKVKTQLLDPAGNTSAEEAHQAGFGIPPDDGGEGAGLCHQKMVLMPSPLNCVRPVASVGAFTALDQYETTNAVAAPSTQEQTAESLSQDNQGETVSFHKKEADALSAAEARRRRKEVIKLKSVHVHP